MMMKLRSGVSLACVISLAAMIGCQVKPPASPTSDETTLNRSGTGRVPGAAGSETQAGAQTGAQTGATAGGTQGTAGGTGSTLNGGTTAGGTGSTATGGTGGTAVGAAITPRATVDGTPSREEVLSKVPAMTVGASLGGLYKSADGRLQAIIPPGVLSGDAEVKFAAVDTTGLPANAMMTPGIMFAMDLGGASLKDGEAIIVKSKVDSRFVEEFMRSAPGKDPASAGLSQEAGVWYLSMPVKGISGPDAQSMQAKQIQGDLATVEMQPPPVTYGLKQASAEPSASPTPTPSATPTAAPTPVPTPTPEPKLPTSPTGDATVDSWGAMTQTQKNNADHRRMDTLVVLAQGHDVTLTMSDTREATLGTANRPEYIQCFIGHGWCDGATIYETIDEVIRFNKGVGSNHLPPAGLTQAVNSRRPGWNCGVIETVDVSAKAVYKSDDNSIDGVAAADATLRVLAGGAEMSRSVLPDGTLTFPVGIGRAFKLYGSIDVPEYRESTPRLDVTAARGMSQVKVEIPKMSPRITVNFSADGEVPAAPFPVHLKYRLDGGAETEATVIQNPDRAHQTVSFYAIVPNDLDHTITLTSFTAENFADDRGGDIGVARTGVHRNKEYTFTARLLMIAPK